LNRHAIVLDDGGFSHSAGMAWLVAAAPAADVVCRCNTISNLIALVRAGVGISILPCLVGETTEDLVRCLTPPDELRSPLWLLYHESQRAEPHIRTFVDFLARHVRSHARHLDPGA
jgi:DNA-binding transcriptional LysR family regulator